MIDLEKIQKIIKNKRIHKTTKEKILNLSEDDFIDNGVEGYVFDLGYNRIIKFARFDSEVFSSDKRKIIKTLKFIKNNKQKNLPTVYDFGMIDDKIYFYVCEKLKKISSREQNIVAKLYDLYEDKEKVNIRTKNKKLIKDYINIFKNKNFLVTDLHDSNIMKDSRGNYKLCDLGCVRLNPLLNKEQNK